MPTRQFQGTVYYSFHNKFCSEYTSQIHQQNWNYFILFEVFLFDAELLQKKLCLNRKFLQDKGNFQLYQESVFILVIKSKGVIKSRRRVQTWIQHGIRRVMYSGAINYLKAPSGKITTNMTPCQNGKWLTEKGVWTGSKQDASVSLNSSRSSEMSFKRHSSLSTQVGMYK